MGQLHQFGFNCFVEGGGQGLWTGSIWQWQEQEQEQRGGRQASAELGGPGQGLLTTHLPPAAPGTGA